MKVGKVLMELSAEKRLLILSGRLTFTEDVKNEIKEIINDHTLNWFEFYKYAMYHKCTTLCWNNLKKIDNELEKKIPKYLYYSIRALTESIKKQNKLYLSEVESITNTLKEKGVICIPVKGAMLISLIYKQYGIRFMGDMDFLIKYDDVNIINSAMNEIGYYQGRFSINNKKFIPLDRTEKIKWKISMSNLFPYIKVADINDELHPSFKADFRYSLDDSLEKDAVNTIIDTASREQKYRKSHAFIHLCTHFYDEVKHTLSYLIAKDLNLIKCCDIREFVIQQMNNNDINEALEFATKYSLQKQVYYTAYILNLIYHDGYEKCIMDKLALDDLSFLEKFGDNTLNENQKFKKNFWDRLFSCSNSDELDNKPTFYMD